MNKIYSFLAAAVVALGFAACDDVDNPFDIDDQPGGGDSTVVVQPSGDGTLENPYNPLGAQIFTKGLAADEASTEAIYIKGIVSSVKEQYSTQFGNATFYISEDGSSNNTFYVFRALYLGNQKYKDGQATLEVGDTVVVCGNVVNYMGNTPETVQGKAYLYSINGKTDGTGTEQPGEPGTPEGDGTLANPFNAAAAIAYTSALAKDETSANDIYIKGKVASIKEAYGTQFGNATFYISDDGTENNAFYVFRALYLGNKKYEAGQTALKVGDEVVVCGKVVNYFGNTPETSAGKAYLYSLNGKTEAEAGGENPGGGEENPGGDVTNPDADASNGGFENWTGGVPTNWKSTTTATKGAITMSTDAHSGTYAAEVAGTTAGNNRLAYTELTLPAGEYTITFYVKAATATGGSVRPGYAIVTNGTISGGNDYKYGDYINDLTTGEWVLVTHTFTLDAQTVVNPVVMIAKKPGANVLIDDFKLVDGSGKAYIK